jgi:hypothetical protein
MKITKFLILLTIFIISCSNDSIDFNSIQGFYSYSIIDFKTGNVKDTLFSCLTKSKLRESDTLKIYSSILGLHLGKRNSLFFLWSVDEVNGKLVPQTFTFYNKSHPTNYTWSVEEKIGFESGTFGRKFKVLSKDTCLNVFSTRLDNILLLEQRDWIDVGGMWGIQLFGFDKNDKLVYLHKYVESKPWSELTKKSHSKYYPNQIVVHTKNHTYQEIKDYLVLSKFTYDNSITEKGCDEWESKNSKLAKEWLDWRDDLIDYIPPPRPSIDNSEPDTLIDKYIFEVN